jgi:hypothetical protein
VPAGASCSDGRGEEVLYENKKKINYATYLRNYTLIFLPETMKVGTLPYAALNTSFSYSLINH